MRSSFDVVQFDTNGAALVIDRCCTVNLPVRDSDFFEGAQRLPRCPSEFRVVPFRLKFGEYDEWYDHPVLFELK